MTIGIGVTSYNRPWHLNLWTEQTTGFTDNFDWILIAPEHEIVWHIEQDTEGIAKAKNNCLRALKDCDYIFLFDDDCFPKKDGWIDFFINAHKASGQHHFMYLKETNVIKKTKHQFYSYYKDDPMPYSDKILFRVGGNAIVSYNNCAGCMLFLTKEVINKVGAFNPAYMQYGYEHAGYSNRIHIAGLTSLGKYLCPAGASEYIHSLDLDGTAGYNIEHYPSLVNKISEIDSYINYNRRIFESDNQIYIPL